MRPTLRRLVPALLVPALVLGGITLPADAREAPVQITIGQPNVWSLEQAHYLLAQMHERSAALKAKLPGEDILDPAGLQGQTFDFLRTAVAADLSFDQTVGTSNRIALETFGHDSARRRQLQVQLDAARARQATLTAEIAQNESRRTAMAAGLPEGTTTPELKTLDATIASMKAEKSAVDGQVTALTNELATLASQPELESSAPETSATLPTHGLAGFLAGLQLATPKLHPSVVLDNFVQFQYEIIAKQLSLLRDELEPNERLVFLELPHAIYTVPARGDDYLARVSWEVAGYCKLSEEEPQEPAAAEAAEAQPQESSSRRPADEAISEAAQRKREARDAALAGAPNREPLDWERLKERCQWIDVGSEGVVAGDTESDAADIESHAADPEDEWRHAPAGAHATRARIIDLIPRTLAVSLDATTASSRSLDLGLSAGTIGGIGLGVALQRQHDLADRLVEQQVFASAEGRGRTEFGWIFAPPPGSDRIHPGDKTTYAILAVPNEAVAIRMRARGCHFHRGLAPGEIFSDPDRGLFARWWRDCGNQDQYFDLRVPGHESDQFFVQQIAYSGVSPSERLAVFVRGRGFSPQTGVMINGTPLKRTLSLATETALPVAAAEPAGLYEIVNSESLLLSFAMPAGYTGTPLITLVSPGKVAAINYYRTLLVNNTRQSLDDYSKHHPMFRSKPEIGAVRTIEDPNCIELLGSGFRAGRVKITFNGHQSPLPEFRSQSLLLVEPPAEVLEHEDWFIRYVDHGTQRHQEATATVTNPFLPRVTELEVIRGPEKNSSSVGFDVLFRATGFTPVTIAPVAASVAAPATVAPRGDDRYFAKIESALVPAMLEICGVPNGKVTNARPCTLFRLPGRPAPPPEVHVVDPASVEVGKALTTVTLRGANFGNVTEVAFGKANARILTPGATQLVVEVPKSDEPGPVRVVLVADHQGKKVDNRADLEALFTYEPAKK